MDPLLARRFHNTGKQIMLQDMHTFQTQLKFQLVYFSLNIIYTKMIIFSTVGSSANSLPFVTIISFPGPTLASQRAVLQISCESYSRQ